MEKSLSQSQNSTFVAEAKSPLFQAVLEGYPNPFAVFELNSNCLGYNRKFHTLMLELYGESNIKDSSDFFDLLTACGSTLSPQDIVRTIEQREILKIITQLTVSNSVIRTFEMVFSPFFIVDNEIGGMTVLMRELFNTEQPISGFHFSEDVFRKAFFTTPDCVNINRFADGRYVLLNPGFTNILGYTEDDILGKTSIEKNIWYDQTDRGRWAEVLKNAGEVKNFITRFRAKDGSIIYATVSSGMIEIDGEKHVLSITRDISDLKHVEEKIKIREGELDTLVNVLPDLVWLKNPNGVYLNCNKRFELFFGAQKEDIVGKTDYDFLDKDLADFFRTHDINAIEAGKPTMNEEWVTFANDNHREFLETLKTPMYDNNGKLLGVLGIGRDLTNRFETEEKLRRSENLFKTIFETSPDVMTITRLYDGIYVNVNDSFTKVLGYNAEEVVGYSALERNIWYDAKERQLLVDLLSRDGAAYNQEFRFLTKTHEIVFGLMSAKVIQIDGESHLLAITRPINDLKAAEDALKESERKFRSIFEQSVVGKSITTIDGNLSVNTAFCDILGYTQEELLELNWKDITYKDDIAFKQNETQLLLSGTKNSTKFESRFVHKTGRIVWADISTILHRDEAGNPLYFVTVINDITDKKLADEKVELSEKRFRALVENVQDMVSIFNAENQIVYTSPAVERITGYKLEDLQQMTGPDFVHPDEMEARNKLKQTCWNNPGVPIHNESRLLHKDGRTIWVEGTVTNLLHDNSVAGIVTNYRDITDRKIAEKQVQDNYDLLSKLTAQVPGVVYQYRLYPDGHSAFPYSSRGMFDIYEVTPEEVSEDASPVFTRIHPDDYDHIVETITESALNQTVYHSEFRVVLPEQGLRWRHCDAKPELLEDGSTLWYGIITDITDRKAAEKILQESEDRHRSLFQRNSSVMLILDPDNGNIIDANPAACNYYGWTYTEMCQKNISDINMLAKEEVKEVLTRTKAELQNHLFLKHRLASGEVRDVEVYATPIKHGNSVLLYSIIHDITDRKIAEEALRISEQKLSALFSSMTEMVVIHEIVFDEHAKAVDYRILDCNDRFTSITGIVKENAVGHLGTEVYNVTPPPYLDIYSEVAITGNSTEFDVHYAPQDKHFIISVVSPSKNQFATITTDITVIKQIQNEISAKNRELESYLYIASHDLRSPLVNIQGFSQRLEKQSAEIKALSEQLSLNQDLRDKIEKLTISDIPRSLNFILTNVTKMDSLINSLLQISRTGRLTLDVKVVDVNKLVGKVLIGYNYELTELEASVLVENLPPCYGDENQLDQVFSNIIGNALKYRSEDRKPEIKISALSTSNKVVYCISDNGRGIAHRHLAKIWDVFYRGDSSVSESGDGIGLSVAKTIITKHKGRIWVESKVGIGSDFYIELHKNEFSE